MNTKVRRQKHLGNQFKETLGIIVATLFIVGFWGIIVTFSWLDAITNGGGWEWGAAISITPIGLGYLALMGEIIKEHIQEYRKN